MKVIELLVPVALAVTVLNFIGPHHDSIKAMILMVPTMTMASTQAANTYARALPICFSHGDGALIINLPLLGCRRIMDGEAVGDEYAVLGAPASTGTPLTHVGFHQLPELSERDEHCGPPETRHAEWR